MKKYLLKRTVITFFTLLIIIFVIFALVRVVPGNPFPVEKMTAEQIAQKRAEMGLDDPILVQFGRYMSNFLQGDFGVGTSLYQGAPIKSVLKYCVANSFKIGGVAVLMGVVPGILFGIFSALYKGGLFDKLCAVGNEVFWHWKNPGVETLMKENEAEVYICSANAIAETGEILNIDGNGNRLAGLSFGKKRVFIVAGTNKICPDFDSALYRARNVAAVQNAKRFPCNTPCKIDGVCHDCRTPDHICNALLVLWGPTGLMQSVEVVLIDEELGM